MLEASFKGVARCLRDAVRVEGGGIPSTKGSRDGWAWADCLFLDYGIGNLRSAEKALQRLGAAARLVDDPRDVAAADGVVLPGVGAFGACARALRRQRARRRGPRLRSRPVSPSSVCVSGSSSSTTAPSRAPVRRASASSPVWWDPCPRA